jgi:hypothetical protein
LKSNKSLEYFLHHIKTALVVQKYFFHTGSVAGGGLSMKCKGWSLSVKNLCIDLDLNLAKLWKEIVEIGKG